MAWVPALYYNKLASYSSCIGILPSHLCNLLLIMHHAHIKDGLIVEPSPDKNLLLSRWLIEYIYPAFIPLVHTPHYYYNYAELSSHWQVSQDGNEYPNKFHGDKINLKLKPVPRDSSKPAGRQGYNRNTAVNTSLSADDYHIRGWSLILSLLAHELLQSNDRDATPSVACNPMTNYYKWDLRHLYLPLYSIFLPRLPHFLWSRNALLASNLPAQPT